MESDSGADQSQGQELEDNVETLMTSSATDRSPSTLSTRREAIGQLRSLSGTHHESASNLVPILIDVLQGELEHHGQDTANQLFGAEALSLGIREDTIHALRNLYCSQVASAYPLDIDHPTLIRTVSRLAATTSEPVVRTAALEVLAEAGERAPVSLAENVPIADIATAAAAELTHERSQTADHAAATVLGFLAVTSPDELPATGTVHSACVSASRSSNLKTQVWGRIPIELGVLALTEDPLTKDVSEGTIEDILTSTLPPDDSGDPVEAAVVAGTLIETGAWTSDRVERLVGDGTMTSTDSDSPYDRARTSLAVRELEAVGVETPTMIEAPLEFTSELQSMSGLDVTTLVDDFETVLYDGHIGRATVYSFGLSLAKALYTNEGTNLIREEIAWSIAKLVAADVLDPSVASLDPLVEELRNERSPNEAEIRAAGNLLVAGIGSERSRDVMAALSPVMREDSSTAIQAYRVLGQLISSGVVSSVNEQTANSILETIRQEREPTDYATRVLGDLLEADALPPDTKPHAPTLIDALETGSRATRLQAVRVLGQFAANPSHPTDMEAIDALVSALNSKDDLVAGRAADVLRGAIENGDLEPPDNLPVIKLVDLVVDRTDQTRVDVVRLLDTLVDHGWVVPERVELEMRSRGTWESPPGPLLQPLDSEATVPLFRLLRRCTVDLSGTNQPLLDREGAQRLLSVNSLEPAARTELVALLAAMGPPTSRF